MDFEWAEYVFNPEQKERRKTVADSWAGLSGFGCSVNEN